MRLKKILETLDRNLIHEVVIYDVREQTPFYDTVVIATTDSLTQMEAAIRYLAEGFEVRGVELANDWTLIDMGDIIINLFSPLDRDKYDLDQILSAYNTMKQK